MSFLTRTDSTRNALAISLRGTVGSRGELAMRLIPQPAPGRFFVIFALRVLPKSRGNPVDNRGLGPAQDPDGTRARAIAAAQAFTSRRTRRLPDGDVRMKSQPDTPRVNASRIGERLAVAAIKVVIAVIVLLIILHFQ
jgi:hypothetical protein